MKLFTKTSILALIATVSLGSGASALNIGDVVLDGGGVQWTYVGDYDVGSGPSWFGVPPPLNYSALQAAGLVFGSLPGGQSYAISTSLSLVDHLAWYDGYGDGSHLPTSNFYGSGLALSESFFADVGATGYTQGGDFSAYLGSDRAEFGGGAINHVFASASSSVPDGGATIALLGLALSGIAAARRKMGLV
jgi:hypothetical protein